MTIFYFVRHGETDFNANNNAYCGRSDVSLNDLGRNQSAAMSEKLQDIKFDKVYVSPLKRAVETASAFTDVYEINENLTEIDFGNWEGLNKQEISTEYSDNWDDWQNTSSGDVRAGETGETMVEVFDRMHGFVQQAVQECPDGKVLIVTHNTAIRLLFTGLIKGQWSKYRSFKCNNTSISKVNITEHSFEFLHLNDDTHLNGVS